MTSRFGAGGRLLTIVGSAGIGLVIAQALRRGVEPGSPADISLAIGQIVLNAIIIVAVIRAASSGDELWRKVQHDALAVSFAGVGIVVSTFGFLAGLGVGTPDWGAWLWPLMTLLWAGAFALGWARYR